MLLIWEGEGQDRKVCVASFLGLGLILIGIGCIYILRSFIYLV